jgi:hypothetical protein
VVLVIFCEINGKRSGASVEDGGGAFRFGGLAAFPLLVG